MALTHFAFCTVGISRNGMSVPMAVGDSVVSQGITPSASNQQTSASTLPNVRISTDTAVYVAFGSNPDATTTTGRYYLPANAVEYFELDIGDKVAVVTA